MDELRGTVSSQLVVFVVVVAVFVVFVLLYIVVSILQEARRQWKNRWP